jgi:hypothetical protein
MSKRPLRPRLFRLACLALVAASVFLTGCKSTNPLTSPLDNLKKL